jgi:osmotically-inducible protein OsmY
MKRYIPIAITAAFSMNAFAAVLTSVEPTWRAESSFKYAQEPVASAVSPQSAAEDLIVRNLVDALNNDDQMKGAKISVQNDNGVALLTGRTDSQAQAQRASQIAAQFAGEGNVVNTIQPARMTYMRPVPMPPDAADQETAG